MEYQEIFEKVRAIVAEVLAVDETKISLDFPLFESELYDKRMRFSGSYARVIYWRSEDAQYYSYEAEVICVQLIDEFDVEFTDESFLEFKTIKRVVDYISQQINACS